MGLAFPPCCLPAFPACLRPSYAVTHILLPKQESIFQRMRTTSTPTHQSLILPIQPTDRPLAGARELVLPQQGRHGTMGTLSRLTHTHT